MKNLIERLASITDPQWIVTDAARLHELSWDALSEARIHPRNSPTPVLPSCAVFPGSVDEVRRIVIMANEEKVPLVPYGGGSGLMGAALSLRPGIVLDLRRMNRIVEIDPVGRLARVQAGIVLEALDQRLNEHGFILGHDPWTLPVATLGGAISTNSVGYRAGLYGSMGEQTLGLEAVMPDGQILRTRGVPKSSTGLSLNSLLVGTEGCFGIVTEATVKIFSTPEKRVFHALAFDSFEHGYSAIQKALTHRLQPALLDFGDDNDKHTPGALLYLAFEGSAAIVDAENDIAVTALSQSGARELPSDQAERFWDDRHAIARHFMANRLQRRTRGKDGVYRDWIHVALPASQVLAYRKRAMEIAESRGVRVQESGLWIRPELFSMRLGTDDRAGSQAQLVLQDTVDELLRLAQRLGGSMEYTHGVGMKLAPLMAEEHGYGLEIMRRIKATLDPNGILNPGKMGL